MRRKALGLDELRPYDIWAPLSPEPARIPYEQAVEWITADRSRLSRMQQILASVAPLEHRKPGWDNDQVNEAGLLPLPFDDISAPTLVAHGISDRNIPVEHATEAAEAIDGAELVLVEEGHHALSLSRRYGPVARRQVELASGRVSGGVRSC